MKFMAIIAILMNTTSTPRHQTMKHIQPHGAEGFQSLPCVYGEKTVPVTPALRGMAICHVTLPPNGETRLTPEEKGHYHRQMTELYCFTAGSGRMLLNGTWRAVQAGTVALVPPAVMHTVAANGERVEFLVLTVPAYQHEDSFDLFDYPPEFSRHDPAWVKELPTAEPTRPREVIELFSTSEWELVFARLAPGASIPSHRHEAEEEAYFIIEGSGTVTLAGRPTRVEPGTFVSIPPGTEHSITAGPVGVCYYVVASPPVAT
jgi:mannose-6-phosphate isomerase-like protein (cupin superfamily)